MAQTTVSPPQWAGQKQKRSREEFEQNPQDVRDSILDTRQTKQARGAKQASVSRSQRCDRVPAPGFHRYHDLPEEHASAVHQPRPSRNLPLSTLNTPRGLSVVSRDARPAQPRSLQQRVAQNSAQNRRPPRSRGPPVYPHPVDHGVQPSRRSPALQNSFQAQQPLIQRLHPLTLQEVHLNAAPPSRPVPNRRTDTRGRSSGPKLPPDEQTEARRLEAEFDAEFFAPSIFPDDYLTSANHTQGMSQSYAEQQSSILTAEDMDYHRNNPAPLSQIQYQNPTYRDPAIDQSVPPYTAAQVCQITADWNAAVNIPHTGTAILFPLPAPSQADMDFCNTVFTFDDAADGSAPVVFEEISPFDRDPMNWGRPEWVVFVRDHECGALLGVDDGWG